MNILIKIIVVIFGLIFGSFFACMGYRIPNKISTIKKRSFCPYCKEQLKWYMNIPVFSFILLRGKCAYCKKEISLIYPLVEISSAILFLLGYITYGFTIDYTIFIILSGTFLTTAVTDFLYYYVSDRVIVISIILIILLYFFKLSYFVLFYKILTGIIMFVFMLLFKFLGDKMFKKESLGGGDIKIMGVIGLTLGTYPIPNGISLSLFVLILSSILGLIFALIIMKKNKNGIVPFGPFLFLSSIIIFYFQNMILTIFSF